MSTALIVVDLQEAFLSLKECRTSFEKALPQIRAAIGKFRLQGDPVVFTRTREALRLEIPGGGELVKGIEILPGDIVFDKNFPNAFWQTSLEHELRSRNVTDVVVCGCFAMACVYLTHHGALERGFLSSILEGGVISSETASIALLHEMTTS